MEVGYLNRLIKAAGRLETDHILSLNLYIRH